MWSLNRKAVFAALVVALASAAILVFVLRRDEGRAPQSLPMVLRAEMDHAKAASVRPVSPQLEPSTSNPVYTKFGAMARELSNASDLRAFAEKARLRPEDGGIAYAHAAALYCVSIRGIRERTPDLEKVAAGDPRYGSRRLQLLSELARRCESFTSTELGGQVMQDEYKRYLPLAIKMGIRK